MTPTQTINEATERLILWEMHANNVSREGAIATLFGWAAVGVMCNEAS